MVQYLKNILSLIEGLKDAMEKGLIAGYPVMILNLTLSLVLTMMLTHLRMFNKNLILPNLT